MSEEATLDEFVDRDEKESNQSKPVTDELEQEQFGPFTLSTPGEWTAKRLGDIKQLITRGKQPTYDDDGVPVINQECIYWNGWHFENLRYLDAEVAEDWKDKYFPQKGDIILNSTGQGTLGRAQVYPDNERRAIDSHVTLLRTTDELSPYFHRYFLESYLGQALLYSMCVNGSTGQIELSKTRLDLQPIPLPPLEEQRKIASVLYNVDQAIQKTEETIGQLDRTRKGIEQDLLSRGISSTGSLREEDEIEYKSSWVGKIPLDWEVRQYEELITKSSVGIVVKPSQYYDNSGSIPILRSKDIGRDGIVDGNFKYMTEESNKENPSSQVHTEDVITVRSGDPGLSCVVSHQYNGVNSADLLISTPGPELNSHFAAMWINSFAGRKQIDRFQAGLAQKHFNLGALRKLRIAVPSLEEQTRIVDTVASVTDDIAQENSYLNQLKRLKQGLMQDLLSGKIRTHDKDIEILDEVAQHG
ncbi:restriction endonuclease subunit S [Halalkalicoccus tibetensis]|uniref:Restriction endonuclease subunit S n=1 Tax=Halalkalicoccus tibetensis TaxID=175632 RepID=A0ABD5V696_9EURY